MSYDFFPIFCTLNLNCHYEITTEWQTDRTPNAQRLTNNESHLRYTLYRWKDLKSEISFVLVWWWWWVYSSIVLLTTLLVVVLVQQHRQQSTYLSFRSKQKILRVENLTLSQYTIQSTKEVLHTNHVRIIIIMMAMTMTMLKCGS